MERWAVLGQLGRERITGALTYLEGLEGEAHVEALGHLDPPDADFAGPVIIWVIGRLDVAVVLFHISPTDSCGDTVQVGTKGGQRECSALLRSPSPPPPASQCPPSHPSQSHRISSGAWRG